MAVTEPRSDSAAATPREAPLSPASLLLDTDLDESTAMSAGRTE
ncbi:MULTISPECIES: hypothetical protein [unclassified Streptomyces]